MRSGFRDRLAATVLVFALLAHFALRTAAAEVEGVGDSAESTSELTEVPVAEEGVVGVEPAVLEEPSEVPAAYPDDYAVVQTDLLPQDIEPEPTSAPEPTGSLVEEATLAPEETPANVTKVTIKFGENLEDAEFRAAHHIEQEGSVQSFRPAVDGELLDCKLDGTGTCTRSFEPDANGRLDLGFSGAGTGGGASEVLFKWSTNPAEVRGDVSVTLNGAEMEITVDAESNTNPECSCYCYSGNVPLCPTRTAPADLLYIANQIGFDATFTTTNLVQGGCPGAVVSKPPGINCRDISDGNPNAPRMPCMAYVDKRGENRAIAWELDLSMDGWVWLPVRNGHVSTCFDIVLPRS